MQQYQFLVLFTIFFVNTVSGDDKDCVKYCKQQSDPVCASNGVIYANECDMKRQTCGEDVLPISNEFCTRARGSTCDSKCFQEYDPVCGTDGRTYLNLCIQLVEYCRRGVELAHLGACQNTTNVVAEPEPCPTFCPSDTLNDGPICGSNGNVYQNSCEMKKRTCGQNVAKTSYHHCQTTKHCKNVCWRVWKPVCGSDAKIYNNDCQMKVRNCGKHVYEVPMSYCNHIRTGLSICPISCEGEPSSPICGSDGHVYENGCEMKKINCGNLVGDVKEIPMVNCVDKVAECDQISCPDAEDYVCGTDGATYQNMCKLKKATCRMNVKLAHVGRCVNLTRRIDCPVSCPDGQFEPVCGSDGNVYNSECLMKLETCGQRVVVVSDKHCASTKDCNRKCSTKSSTVCGSDGKVYRNSCHMKTANCGKSVFEVPLSRCLKGLQFSGCLRICPPLYDPVCGTDGKTYSNECFLELEHCRSRSLVTKKYYGKCGEPLPEAKNYLY